MMATRSYSSDHIAHTSFYPTPNQFMQNAAMRTNFEAFDERLASFINWPHKDRLSPSHMAATGFYQERPSMDRVSCFCCDVALEDWSINSDPITEHQHASPACTWNNNTYMTTLEERLGSFHSWPIHIKPLPITMASAGFYHSNKSTDGVTCFSCKLALKDWKRGDDPIKQHEQHCSPGQPCTWLIKVTSSPDPYIPPTPSPPPGPPVVVIGAIPRECPICQETFPSGHQLTKHGRRFHGNFGGKLIGRKIVITARRSGPLQLGQYRVTKLTHRCMKAERRNTAGLYGRTGRAVY